MTEERKKEIDDLSPEYYEIFERCGTKFFNPAVYYYNELDELVKGKPARVMEYGVTIPLKEFIEIAKNEDSLNNWMCEAIRWCDDLMEDEYWNEIDECDKKYKTVLAFEDITLDTPCGNYRTW